MICGQKQRMRQGLRAGAGAVERQWTLETDRTWPYTLGETGSSIIVGGQDTNNPYVNFIQILLNSIPFFRM